MAQQTIGDAMDRATCVGCGHDRHRAVCMTKATGTPCPCLGDGEDDEGPDIEEWMVEAIEQAAATVSEAGLGTLGGNQEQAKMFQNTAFGLVLERLLSEGGRN